MPLLAGGRAALARTRPCRCSRPPTPAADSKATTSTSASSAPSRHGGQACHPVRSRWLRAPCTRATWSASGRPEVLATCLGAAPDVPPSAEFIVVFARPAIWPTASCFGEIAGSWLWRRAGVPAQRRSRSVDTPVSAPPKSAPKAGTEGRAICLRGCTYATSFENFPDPADLR